jgi:hypothetical protein
MTTMTEERAQEPRRAISRPASGVAIDPRQLIAWRARRAMSRQDLADAVAALGWTDDRGRPVRYTRDAIAKSENGYRKPKPRTLRALCAALSTEDDPCEPLDLMPGEAPAQLPAAARRQLARLDYNAAMRAYAGEAGISFRNPDDGRIYYPRELREKFARHVLDEAVRDSGCALDELHGDTVDLAWEDLRDVSASVTGRECPVTAREPLAREVPDPGASLSALDLTVRVYNCLRRDGIETVGQLAALTRAELQDIRNLGPRGQDEIISALARLAARPALAEPAQLAS